MIGDVDKSVGVVGPPASSLPPHDNVPATSSAAARS
jgi:hypothetical protein